MIRREYYECHITIAPGKGDGIYKNHVMKTIEDLGWKYSQIYGDPTLGDSLFMYATKHFQGTMDIDAVVTALSAAAQSLRGSDIGVIREKVERVIYDTKCS